MEQYIGYIENLENSLRDSRKSDNKGLVLLKELVYQLHEAIAEREKNYNLLKASELSLREAEPRIIGLEQKVFSLEYEKNHLWRANR